MFKIKKGELKRIEDFERELFSNDTLIKELWEEVLEASELERVISDNSYMDKLVEKIKKERGEVIHTGEQLKERILSVHKCVLNKVPNNLEINLNEHILIDFSGIREVEDILIKLRFMEDNSTGYICLNANQFLEIAFYLGGEQKKAYIVSKDEHGNLVGAELMEFQFLSIVKESSGNDNAKAKEYGLLVNYHWMVARIESTILVGWNLNSLKNLMLGDWFQALINSGEKNEKVEEA